MSREVAALVYSRRVGSPAKKAVLAYFADKADAHGKGVFPSKQTMADVTELGKSTVIRAINEMIGQGLIAEVGKRKCQSGATTIYDMDLAAISALPASVSEREYVPERDPMLSQSGTPKAVPERDCIGKLSQSGMGVVPERDPMLSQSGTQTVLEPSLNKEEVPIGTMCDAKEPSSPHFDEFWSAWPLSKVGKDAARKAFGRLSPQQRIGATSQAIAWCGAWREANPRLNDIHPSTYLNNKRWEDEIQPAQPNLTMIPGGQNDQSPQQKRIDATANTHRRVYEAAIRNRRPSGADPFGS